MLIFNVWGLWLVIKIFMKKNKKLIKFRVGWILNFSFIVKKKFSLRKDNLDDIFKDNFSFFWGNDILLVGLNINE